jgi:hypothetical protein
MDKKIPEGWYIEYAPPPIPLRQFDYEYWHDSYDGENGLCGMAASVNAAIEEIEEIEEQQ